MDTLVWVDLETEGLEPEQHQILEACFAVTDINLNLLVSYNAPLRPYISPTKDRLSVITYEMHTKSGLLKDVAGASLQLHEYERNVVAMLKNFINQPIVLCGNSVWFDKSFIVRHMPTLAQALHYRVIDVSSFKEFVGQRYGIWNVNGNPPHRAYLDLMASIEEMKTYVKLMEYGLQRVPGVYVGHQN